MDIKNMSLEDIIFQFIDKCKFLFFPEQWNQTFMDYSKNEVFTLFFIYRKEQVNMTEIADHLNIPLNTATGIISRLEKRDVVLRERDKDDKRIVVVKMSSSGRDFIKEQMSLLEYYFELIMSNLDVEEMDLVIKIVSKLFDLFANNKAKENNENENSEDKKVKRIVIE